MVAETCVSIIVVTKKAFENYYLSQVGHGMPYFAVERVQQDYGLGNLFSSIVKKFSLWSKKVPKSSENKFRKAISSLLWMS